MFNIILGGVVAATATFFLGYALVFVKQLAPAVKHYEKVRAAMKGDFDLQTFCRNTAISYFILAFGMTVQSIGHFMGITAIMLCGLLATFVSVAFTIKYSSRHDRATTKALGVYLAILAGSVIFVFGMVVIVSLISGNTAHFLL